MREIIWLRLRKLRFLRKLYDVPIAREPLKTLSLLLLPHQGRRRLRIRTGPGEGLLFELNPRWETHLWEGEHELMAQRAVLDKLKSGAVFYDVGAGFGLYSLMAARAGARVFAFEPDVQNAESILRCAKWNSLEGKVEIIRLAVLSKSGHTDLEPADHERGHGNAHVLESAGAEQLTITVPCTSLDDFARLHPLPDVIKIDVEGSESQVLKGSDELLRRSQPEVICEVHDAQNASFVQEWLRARGYRLRWVDHTECFPKQLIATPE